MESRVIRESRHSDYGEDAGGYSILRFDGAWFARIEDSVVAEKFLAYVKKLEDFRAEVEKGGK